MNDTIEDMAAMVKREARHAYYRRCQAMRRNGEQCKAPALKGHHLCYKHDEQATAGRKYEELRQSLGLTGVKRPRDLQRVLTQVAQGLLDGTIDSRTAARLTVEINRVIR